MNTMSNFITTSLTETIDTETTPGADDDPRYGAPNTVPRLACASGFNR